ncbi:MAG: ribonuclease III [Deltaproteobacteria bacterium]|nr:ribonuclease III [Deltaproteobacteria bacterium]TLN05185.1 MAG: ribonuclease III [bacterium]
MQMSREELLKGLEEALDYRFTKREVLLEALTHRSFVNELRETDSRDNQRLEFFGDAVLGLLVSRRLLERFPSTGEGDLSRLRAALVDEAALAQIAEKIQLGKYLLLGRGEEKTGGRKKKSVLSDALEALVAAVYLDGGIPAAERLVDLLFGPLLETSGIDAVDRDYKTRFQELCHARHGKSPHYVLEEVSGPDHDRLFVITAHIGETFLGKGVGKSKKIAEQAAAKEALGRFEEMEKSET